MATVVDTPDGIAYAQLLSIIGRLKLEQQGITFRLPTLKAARRLYGLENIRTKAAMVAHLEAVRDMVKAGDVLWPVGDGTVGLFDREELQADLARHQQTVVH